MGHQPCHFLLPSTIEQKKEIKTPNVAKALTKYISHPIFSTRQLRHLSLYLQLIRTYSLLAPCTIPLPTMHQRPSLISISCSSRSGNVSKLLTQHSYPAILAAAAAVRLPRRRAVSAPCLSRLLGLYRLVQPGARHSVVSG